MDEWKMVAWSGMGCVLTRLTSRWVLHHLVGSKFVRVVAMCSLIYTLRRMDEEGMRPLEGMMMVVWW